VLTVQRKTAEHVEAVENKRNSVEMEKHSPSVLTWELAVIGIAPAPLGASFYVKTGE